MEADGRALTEHVSGCEGVEEKRAGVVPSEARVRAEHESAVCGFVDADL
jgi:hypothetical protein